MIDVPDAFRRALGSFATGVTIVTTMGEGPVGVTASSFNSVSLEPPLVLWSLAKTSRSIEAFRRSGHFAVHVLTTGQDELSNRFARSGHDKFEGLPWKSGVAGSPILDEHCAVFECRTVHRYEGGDHDIFVGEVVAFEEREGPPLLFHGGRYAEARPRLPVAATPAVSLAQGSFTRDFLLYLISRAHFVTSLATRRIRDQVGLSESEFLALSALSMGAPLSTDQLRRELAHTGLCPEEESLTSLVRRGLIADDGVLALTERGRAAFIPMLAAAKDVEDGIGRILSPSEIEEAKSLLRRLIASVEEI